MRMMTAVRNWRFRTWRGRGLALMALLLWAQSSPQVCADLSAYERGLEAVAERRLADAIEPLQQALALAETAEDRARIGLLLGTVLQMSRQSDAAIRELERVLEYDPHLRQDYPSVKFRGLNPQVELGYAYRDKGDLNAAIAWWETYLTWRIASPRTILNDMVARRTLADDGELQAPPMVHRSCYGFIPSRLDEETQRLLVPATRLAEALGAECAMSDDGTTATFARAEAPTVRVQAGATVAVVDGQNRTMAASPQVVDGELWVPLRFVAQALGHTLEWEPGPRIAWVHGRHRQLQRLPAGWAEQSSAKRSQ